MSPRQAKDQQRALQAVIDKLESDVRDANERAEITSDQNRQLWAEIAKLKDRLVLAEGMASIVLYGEATRI